MTIRVIKLDWFVFVRRDVLSFFGVEVDGRSDVAVSYTHLTLPTTERV